MSIGWGCRRGLACLLVVMLILTLMACASARAPTSTTFQTIADPGRVVYLDKCGVCHGNNGQPANKYMVLLWGNNSTLGNFHGIILFKNAEEMLSYLSKYMPLADSGSLSHQQYIEVMAYILIQANIVSPSTAFDESNLSDILMP